MNERRLKTRTHYIHRLKYTTQERIAGAFVLGAIGILVWLLFTSSKSLIVFEDYATIYGKLDTIQPIDKDTEVVVSGLSAGSIVAVDITSDNKVIVTMKILERYRSLLRIDSVAVLNTFNLAVIDKSIIEITAGSPSAPVLQEGSTITIKESINIKNMLAEITPAIEGVARTINRIDEILSGLKPAEINDSVDRINHVISQINPNQIRSLIDNVETITANAKAISNQVNAGNGLAGSVIYDKELQTNMKKITMNLENATFHMKQLLAILNEELKDMPGLLQRIDPLIQEADKTIKATQRIWPLSTTIDKDSDSEKLTPQAPAND